MKLDAAEEEEGMARGGGGQTDDRAPRLNERAAFQSIGGNSCRWQCCCCCCSVAVATKRGRQQQQLLLLRMLLCLIKRLPRCEAATLVVTFARPIDTHLNDDNDAAGAALACLAPASACPSSCCTASLAQLSLTLPPSSFSYRLAKSFFGLLARPPQRNCRRFNCCRCRRRRRRRVGHPLGCRVHTHTD